MTTIIKNQIVKQLARFTKNLSPSKISLKFLKGEGELRNLELNEKFLTDLLELPPFIRLTRAVCNKISAKIHWTRLKTDPIRLFLDCVEVDMEMIENVSEDIYLNQPSVTTAQTPREKPSEYGFAEKVVDGMHVTINSVVMAFKTSTFRATCQMSHLSVHSTDPGWEKASLRNARIKDERGKEVLTFKQITFGTLRVDADALYKSGQHESLSSSSPLRLITSAAKLNIVIKKKIEDCSVVGARLHAICDDILWVLTHAQLQAVASFAKSVVQIVEKCKKSEPAPSVASDDSTQSYNPANENWSENVPTTDHPSQTPSSLFQREDVKETSYRVTTGKIDIHLCDDTPIEKSFMDGNGQTGGSMQIVVNKLSLEHYPYHLAFTSRVHWASHNDASLTRAHWVQELFNSFKKVMKEEGKKSRRKPNSQTTEQSSENTKYMRPGQDYIMNKNVVMATDGIPKKPPRLYLYECAFVISCDEFIVMPVTTNDMTSTSTTPFLCSDKKSLFLPSDLPTLQFDYTIYFYPGQEDARVPQPNLFCQLNPLHLTMDNVTCIWFNRFMQSIRSGFAWAEEIIAAQETEPRHIDVRIEGLMPKLTLPCQSDPSSYYKQYRPQALQIQMSSFRVSNTRIGMQFKQSDLVNTLEVFLQSQLYRNGEVFPNHDSDVKPLPQMSWLNDFSVSTGIANIERVEGDVTDIFAGGHHSVVWMLNVRQCWCDFVGIEEANGRPRPFIEPFPLNLCMCYPIASGNRRPERLSLRDDVSSMSSEYSLNSTLTPLHRSPSDPYCRQTKPYRKSSSTASTPLSSPGFAKIHKSRSATSVNIPVLSSDRRDVTMTGLSPYASKSGSEESMSSFTEDSVISGSTQSISSNSVRSNFNGKVSESSKLTVNNGKSTVDSCGSSNYRTAPFVNSTSGIESNGSSESFIDKALPRSKLPDSKRDNPECALSILLSIPSVLAIKLDHYQFVFLMRLQESFVTLRDVLFADLEKFDVQRREVQEKESTSSGEIASNDPGILVSLVSQGAEVVLLVPAPNDDQSQTQICTESNDREPSSNVVESTEAIDVDNDPNCSIKDYQFSPRDNERLLEKDLETYCPIEVPEAAAELRTSAVAHRRSGSETSSVNTSTFGSDYSLLNAAATGSEQSCEGRDISTVTITGTAFECSVAMKDDDFAFKLLACGCDVSESYHENLEAYLSQKSKVLRESRAASKGCGEIRLRYAMGSTIDQTMPGAHENGVAHLMLSDALVPLLMSNVDGVLECVQDEVELPPPFIPAIIDIKNLRLNIVSDTPPRLLSVPSSLPLAVHIDQGTITRTGNGEVQISIPRAPAASATRQNLHRTHDGLLVTSDVMIEQLREKGNEMTSRVASIRSENVRLLNELQVSSEIKESLESERDRLLVTVERLTDELVKSNREYDKMQEVVRHLQRSDRT